LPAFVQLHKRGEQKGREPPKAETKTEIDQLLDAELAIYRSRCRDGGTAWRTSAPATGWPILPGLEASARAGRRALELRGPEHVPIPVKIQRVGRRIAIETGSMRLEVGADYAEILVKSIALETEGLRAWYVRELPRAHWWLTGQRLLADDLAGLVAELEVEGWRQHRIEQCLDVGLFPLIDPLQTSLVAGRLRVDDFMVAGVRSGVVAGTKRNPERLKIYNKAMQLAQLGAPHRALVEAVEAAGWRPGQPWTRIELTSQGEGLVVMLDGQPAYDGRHPGAALDDELCSALWRRGTARIRLPDVRQSAGRPRDLPTSKVWLQVQDAAAQVYDEQARTAMGRGTIAQWETTHAHRIRSLRRDAVAIGVLERAVDLHDAACRAAEHVHEQLGTKEAKQDWIRSRADFDDLLSNLDAQEKNNAQT
jgi:hypothetical protein